MAEEKTVEKLLAEIESLKKEIEELKSKCEEKDEEKKAFLEKDKVVEIIDQAEEMLKKTFSVLEGAIIGSLEGIKKNLKGSEEKDERRD